MDDLKERLRAQAERASDIHRGMAEDKSLRQPGNHERRTDLYMWPTPEQTIEGKALARIEALEQRVSELEEALTPSAKTKAAYSCEFEFSVGIAHPRLGSEWRSVMVPWTTIKEIMAAIRAHAALNREPNP
jgi:hypothetical protein